MGMTPYDRYRDRRGGYYDPYTGCWCPRRRRRRRRYGDMNPYSRYNNDYDDDWDWDDDM